MSVRNPRTPAGRAVGGRGKKLGTGILVLLGLFLGFLGLAPSAGAHHPSLTASVACATTPDTYVVSFTSSTWDTSSSAGLNNEIRILTGPASLVWPANDDPTDATDELPVGYSHVGTGKYEDTSNPDTDRKFSGTFDVTGSPGDQIDVIAWAYANWGNGGSGHELRGADGSSDGTPVKLTLPGTCPVPDMDATLECAPQAAQTGLDLTVTNNGSAPGDLTIAWTVNGAAQTAILINDLAGGASQDHFLAIPEGATYSITFTGDKGADATPANIGPTALDCLTPAVPGATVQWECGAANATVTLTKTGQESVTATILKNGVPVLSGQPVPGAYQVPITGADEDSTVVITVTFSDAGAGTDKTLNVPVDCDHPDPKVGTPECASGGFSVLLDNEDGDDEATFVVNGTNVVVPAGDSVTHPIAAAEGATVHITVTAGGVTLLDDDFTRECEAAVASLSVECATGGVLVKIQNDGELPGLFTVGALSETIDPGESFEFSVSIGDGPFSIAVFGPGLSGPLTGERDCEPDPSQTLDLAGVCDENAPWIEYSVDDGLGAPVGLQAAGVVDSVDIRWYTIGTPNVLELEQLDMPGSARILWPGAVIDPETGEATDWPGWIQEADGSWVQGDDGFLWATGTVLVEVSSNGEVVSSEEVTYPPAKPDCNSGPPEEVEGEVITSSAAAALPATGSNTTGLLGLAGALLLAGGLAHLVGNRRREQDLS